MGQTLTNGIYLPAEGERNCYDGLEGNWRSLDGLISTVAGKASATHTHGNITNDGKVGTTANVPLITGTGGAVTAGSFGNSANTFCEGNDSRLSDARTPVAHTHTKSDVTDLFNSANTWTGDNTFSSATNSVFCFKFGTSGSYSDIRWKDNNGSHYATLRGRVNELTLGLQYSSASAWYNGASVNINNNGSVQIKAYDGTEDWTVNFTPLGVYPTSSNALELGTSTNKWKTLNGINPGTLSLPDYDSTAKLNLTSTFPAPDSNGNIWFTPTMSGWLYLFFDVTNATTSDNIFYAEIKDSNMANANAAQFFWRLKPADDFPVFFPVIANKRFIIQTNFTNHTLVKALLIPGMGHVA